VQFLPPSFVGRRRRLQVRHHRRVTRDVQRHVRKCRLVDVRATQRIDDRAARIDSRVGRRPSPCPRCPAPPPPPPPGPPPRRLASTCASRCASHRRRTPCSGRFRL